MKLDVLFLQTMYQTLEDLRKVNKLGFSQEDIYKLGHTINQINALKPGKAILGDELLSEYSIPDKWKELIQPSEIKFSSDMLAKDLKDRASYEGALVVKDKVYDECLTSHEWKKLWHVILGSYKGETNDTPIKDLRVTKTLSEVGKHTITAGQKSCIDDGLYIPYTITTQTYEDAAYTVTLTKMYEKWLDNIITGK